MLLSIKNVSKIYDNGTIALKNVSFDVEKGEFISVIGPSGSGKSTLLRSINKMIDISEGSILFEDKNIENLKKGEIELVRREIGMIFQNYNLVERLTVIENVLHGRLGYKSIIAGILGIYSEEEKKEAFNFLEKVNMTKYAYQKCNELSGGQKQRVGIARAIMQKPKLLLCDEPIASLDPKTAENIMDYLKKIVSELKITCIVNLHQVDIAKKYSDRIIALNKGEKIFDDKTGWLTDDMIEFIYKDEEQTQ
ncbi:phosphonate ABC transporter ATP-binding protein [Leptotrichia trevisanii]|uniref:Phosphonate ABC transporter ATPase n=1 Tax=Leptotrichia trevisanii TaxID=109328 RepID=A0A510K450_9FUSO|nr:phosphonate ABC transporter ATP-binding protein [Leptotrichia trevisanii]BBM46314.1 phosphonate ABC transporter ATPase [Leptotrichia trevisanii]